MSLLDRHLLRRSGLAMLLIIALVSLLVLSIQGLLMIDKFLSAELPEGQHRATTILQWFLYQLPGIIGPLLPIACAGGAMMTLAPMLRRNELTALGAAGISMRRATRACCWLAIMAGGIDYGISDHLAPHIEGPKAAIEDSLMGSDRRGQAWLISETGTHWYANRVNLQNLTQPRFESLIIAPPGDGLLQATSLSVNTEGQWQLTDVHGYQTASPDEEPQLVHHASLTCSEQLAIPLGPSALSESLASRYSLSSFELLARGGHANLALAYSRWLRLLAPLLCIMCALPVFVRFDNRDRLLVSAIRALLACAVPSGILIATGLSAESSTWHPTLIFAIGTALACLASGLWYRQWKL